jgi:sugar transferase (PEP-CTERM/EpsH1 system associated)
MKILFLTPQLPYPPRQGTAIRNWGLISHLARRHTLSLLSFASPDAAEVAPVLRDAASPVVTVPVPPWPISARVRALLSGQPDLARRLWSPGFAAALQGLLRAAPPDLIQFEGLELATYLSAAREAAPAAKLIYDAHNAEHMLQRRAWHSDRRRPARWPAAAYSLVQTQRLARLEAQVCATVDAVLCVSASDATALSALAHPRRLVVVPNGIDADDYALVTAPEGYAAGPADLVFTGKMDYRPNVDAAVWFAAEVLPPVRAAAPAARFVIVGQRPAPAVERLRALPGVVVTGGVADARPYIAGAAVYVAPLRMGGGTRFKLLEAFALERPVVATRQGAEGFDVSHGRELLLADSASEIAAEVARLLADPALGRRLGRAGRAFVLANHDWRAILPRLESGYTDLGQEQAGQPDTP